MGDFVERQMTAKKKAETEKYMKEAMPSLQKGKIPETKMNESEVSDLGALVRDQAKAKKAVEKSGNVEMNVGQLRNVGEGPMVLRTETEEPEVDAITSAAPTVSGKGGVPPRPVAGAIPPASGPQIVQDGPPIAETYNEETPDMRMKEAVPAYQAALDGLAKEEGPGFWDVLEAAAAGWGGRQPAYAEKQAEKRGEASKMRLMEKEAAINKANQLEILAKQAEIEGNRDKALALQREAEQQRDLAGRMALLDKEYGLKSQTGGLNIFDLAKRLVGGQ